MERLFSEHTNFSRRIGAGFVLATLASLVFNVHAAQLPADFTVEGRLYTAGGAPLTTAVDIKLELVDENLPSCVIYRELRPSVDLSASTLNAQGVFSLRLGAVTADFGPAPLNTLFAPGTYVGTDATTGSACTATAAPASHRQVRISISEAGQDSYEHLTPDTRLTAVPMAMVAENALTVQGVGTSSLLILNPATSLQQPSFDYLFATTNYDKLKALVDGTSAQYLGANPTAPVPFDHQRLTSLADPTSAQDAATKHYADTMIAGSAVDVSGVGLMTGDASVIKWDAVQNKWVAGLLNTAPTGTAGGDLAGTYPSPSIKTGAVTVAKLSSAGAGANRLLITDPTSGNTVGFGVCTMNQVYAWTALGWTCTDAASLSAVTSVAGKTGAVTLNAADVGGLGTAALYDVGTGANQIPRLDGIGRLPAADGSQLTNVNATKLQSLAIANIMPATGQVLGWNGTAWTPTIATAGSVTSVGAGAGLLGGPITGVGTLRVDVGTGANQVVQLSPAAQLPSVDGTLLTNISASKLLGRPLSPVPPGDNQVLSWSASASQWRAVSTATGTMTSVTAANGLTGGIITSVGTIGVDTGTAANKIVQLNANAQLGVIDGSLLFNVNASKLQTRPVSTTLPLAGQVLGWNVTSSQWEPSSTSGGTVTSVNAGAGLLGGNIVGAGTIAVDVGTAANKILQLNSSAQISAVDGSLLSNINAVKLQARAVATTQPAAGQVLGWNVTSSQWEPTSTTGGTVTSVNAGTGLLGGNIVNSGTIAVDVGTTANKILQLNSSAQINAVDGSLLFNINAVKLQTRSIASTQPVGGQVLGWNVTSSQWEPTSTTGGTVTSVNAGTGLLGGNIVNSGTIAVDAGTGANQMLQLNSSAQIAAVDGSLLKNINAIKLQTRAVAVTPPSAGQVLGWNGVSSSWEPTSNGVSQWVTNGLNINYPSGNVGIGSTAPNSALSVAGDVALTGNLLMSASGVQLTAWNAGVPAVQPIGPNANGALAILPSGSNSQAALLVAGNSFYGTNKYTAIQQSGTNSSIVNLAPGLMSLNTNALSNQLVLDPGGRVGIGTAVPAAGLDLALTGTGNSALIVPRDTSANRPSVPANGMLRYNTNLAVMEGYINGAWASLSTGTSAGTLQSITAGTGLLGGSITTNGTISVDVGSSAGQVVRENASAQIAQLAGTAALPAYGFAGNVGTGVFSPGANQLAFATSGTSAITITNVGDVLFTGTTASSGGNNGAVRVAGGLGVMGQISSSAYILGVKLVANSAMPYAYTSTGTSPGGFPLGAEVAVYNQSTIDTGLSLLRMVASNNATTQQNGYVGTIASASGYTPSIVIGVQNGPNSYAERLRIDAQGEVGIGTAAPAAGLDVATLGASSAIIVPRDTTLNRPSGAINGMIRYNTTLAKFEAYQNGAWSSLVTTGTAAAATSMPAQVQFGTATGVGGSSNFTYAEPAGLALATPLSVTGTSTFNNTATFNKVVAQNVATVPSGTLDMSTSNIFTSSFTCGTFTLTNLVSGATYTVVATDTGTAACGFAQPGFTFKYMPPNDVRTANSHSIYNLMVIGTTVYVSWSSGFK